MYFISKVLKLLLQVHWWEQKESMKGDFFFEKEEIWVIYPLNQLLIIGYLSCYTMLHNSNHDIGS